MALSEFFVFFVARLALAIHVRKAPKSSNVFLSYNYGFTKHVEHFGTSECSRFTISAGIRACSVAPL